MTDNYPRLLEYETDVGGTVNVKFDDAGRLDRIAKTIYGTPLAYRALLVANNMHAGVGFRTGIRPRKEAYVNELRRKGDNNDKIAEKLRNIDEYAVNDYTWHDGQVTTGMMSECYFKRLLVAPSAISTNAMMSKYGDLK